MNLPNFNTLTRDEALAFCLAGLQTKRAEIDATLRDLRSQLNGAEAANRKDIALAQVEMTRQYAGTTWPELAREELKYNAHRLPKRYKRSPAARKRMAEAQRARWAKVKGERQ